MASDDAQPFASWKLDWIDALTIGVEGRDLAVAIHLLQCQNRDTGIINPSQQRIALILGCSLRSVERAINHLARDQVIAITRYRRRDSVRYAFLEPWKEQWLPVKRKRESDWRDLRTKDPTNVAAREHPEDDEPGMKSVSDPTDLTGPDPTDLTGKHLNRTPSPNPDASSPQTQVNVPERHRLAS